jgi:hypothetical protein
MKKVLVSFFAALTAIFFLNSSFSQNIPITGTIQHSSTSEWLDAIGVTVKGSDSGVFTNDKGQFTILVHKLPVRLIASCVGFDPQEIAVNYLFIPVVIRLNMRDSTLPELINFTRVPEKPLIPPTRVRRINQ